MTSHYPGTPEVPGRDDVLYYQNSNAYPVGGPRRNTTRRNRPMTNSVVAAKTRLCTRFVKGVCNSANCTFAHGDAELRKKPDLRKTKLCDAFSATKTCAKGTECTYAHGYNELQSASEYDKAWKNSESVETGVRGADSNSFFDSRTLAMDGPPMPYRQRQECQRNEGLLPQYEGPQGSRVAYRSYGRRPQSFMSDDFTDEFRGSRMVNNQSAMRGGNRGGKAPAQRPVWRPEPSPETVRQVSGSGRGRYETFTPRGGRRGGGGGGGGGGGQLVSSRHQRTRERLPSSGEKDGDAEDYSRPLAPVREMQSSEGAIPEMITPPMVIAPPAPPPPPHVLTEEAVPEQTAEVEADACEREVEGGAEEEESERDDGVLTDEDGISERSTPKRVHTLGRSSSMVCNTWVARPDSRRSSTIGVDRYSVRAGSVFQAPRRASKQSVLCIDLSDSKPAAAEAYPLAALVGRHMDHLPRRRGTQAELSVSSWSARTPGRVENGRKPSIVTPSHRSSIDTGISIEAPPPVARRPSRALPADYSTDICQGIPVGEIRHYAVPGLPISDDSATPPQQFATYVMPAFPHSTFDECERPRLALSAWSPPRAAYPISYSQVPEDYGAYASQQPIFAVAGPGPGLAVLDLQALGYPAPQFAEMKGPAPSDLTT